MNTKATPAPPAVARALLFMGEGFGAQFVLEPKGVAGVALG
jgi:hypothetical protein